MTSSGIPDLEIRSTPLAIVDLETTGLLAGGDKIVEIGVVRLEPARPATTVLDTLVDPHRPVTATEIHGITDADVIGAPGFEELAGNTVEALGGAVMASYNVYFDARFLGLELSQAGVTQLPPYLCLMYMRCLLDLGRKCTLDDACRGLAISHTVGHHAATDALACAKLWQAYTAIMVERGLRTFGDLSKAHSYKFMDSFACNFFDEGTAKALPRASRLKPRSHDASVPATVSPSSGRVQALAEYWDSLMSALSDLTLTDVEVDYLRHKQIGLALAPDEVRWMHGRAFSSIIGDLGQDKAITTDEAKLLWGIAAGLRSLGWAPGDHPDAGTRDARATEVQSSRPPGGMLRRLLGGG